MFELMDTQAQNAVIKVVGVGGGGGNQSIPLARSGYQGTIVDPSAAMLAEAAENLAAEPRAVAGRIRLVQAGAADAAAALGGQRFAGVLCHGVIIYVDEPGSFPAALSGLAEPGGLVSVVAKNARCLAVRPAIQGRWDEALGAFDGVRQVNGLGLDTRADTVEELTALLGEAGVRATAWYGVRLFTDGWTPADRLPAAAVPDQAEEAGHDAARAMLAVELEASRRDPYRQLSRLFHLVVIRQT